jgi:hypothetical protein
LFRCDTCTPNVSVQLTDKSGAVSDSIFWSSFGVGPVFNNEGPAIAITSDTTPFAGAINTILPETGGFQDLSGYFGLAAGTFEFQSGDIGAVPIPAALPLFGTALAGMGAFARWRKRRVAAV